MPRTIDDAAMGGLKSMDFANPPTKAIPHLEFPKCVYLWPKDETKECLSKVVNDEKELQKALKEGWRKEHRVPVSHVQEIDPEEYDIPGKK